MQFTDLHGAAKGKLVPLAELDHVLAAGAGFSGPSIWGTGLARTGTRSEYYARGDASTTTALPWLPGVARIVGDGYVAGAPFDACPRQVLRRAVARLAERGLRIRLGIEPEFFLLKRAGDRWLPADDNDRLAKPSYDVKSLVRQVPFLHELRAALEAAGLTVLQLDHEDAQGQYEVNFAHDEALASCDHLMLFKLAAYHLAEARGVVFSMMPKPFADRPGSGMHFHVSLSKSHEAASAPPPEGVESSGKATLTRQGDRSRDADTLRHFMAGTLAHSAALAALAAPTVNSYKRLQVFESISGTSWAPAYVAHGPNNRTALVRTLPGRFEWRLPDSSANPYLASAGLIAAGLDGIARRLDPGPACTDDLFDLSLAEVGARRIALLPQSLDAAIDALEGDAVVRGVLGDVLAAQFVALKRDEWNAYRGQVSAWEFERYATAF